MDFSRTRQVSILLPFLLILAGKLSGADLPTVTVQSPAAHSGKLALTARISANPFSVKNLDGQATKAGSFKPGESLEIVVEGSPAKGFHTYPATARTSLQDEAMLSSIVFDTQGALFPIWPMSESAPQKVLEEAFGGEILEFAKPFQWSIPAVINPKIQGDTAKQIIKARIQVCDEKGCHWGDHLIEVTVPLSKEKAPGLDVALPKTHSPSPSPKVLNVSGPPGVENTGSRQGKPERTPLAHMPTRIPQLPEKGTFREIARYPEGTIHQVDQFKLFLRDQNSSESENQNTGLLEFMLLGMFWGGISLVTPCVFPMIPVTVSIFLKQKDEGGLSPLTKALIYCGTITVVLTLAAVLALSLFVWLSINWIFNTLMGLLFIFFALSLFGMYDIELPAWLTSWSSQNEQKGGATGTIFMALTFSMLSFACVAPFLGGFGANSAGRPFIHQILGGLAFSATFAAPFFFLALFPGLLRSMPRSGTWLNTIKVAMGFVELMAAIKFFRLAEIREGTATWFTYDFCLACTLGILISGSFYLFQFFRLPLDTEQDHLSVPRMTFGIGFLSLSLYLLPGMFHVPNQGRIRPQGVIYAWIDSFLLPDNETGGKPGTGQSELPWHGDLALALEESRKDGKPVFIDFTGVTCTNCKLNEKQVFSRPDVATLLGTYHLVQLYTDRVIPEFIPEGELQKDKRLPGKLAEANSLFRNENFKVEQLPFYVIISPI
jgi:thiol:disulfide interchange protein DsbD